MDVSPLAWAGAISVISVALLLDLFVFHRDAHEVSTREAVVSSAVWIALGVAFGAVVWWLAGGAMASAYYAGYLVEKSLSVDNIFVFALLFASFGVPARLQHRVLFWGVLGALVLRAGFIAAGSELLHRFHWAVYVFGAFLLVTGIRMLRHDPTETDPSRNPVLRLLRRHVPMTTEYHDTRLTIRRDGRRLATPLLATLVAVESTDVVFAVDSIPAVFAVTDEPFLVFTSNAFAMLGLRSLYFLLAGALVRLPYLRHGLAAVLAVVGVKMLTSTTIAVAEWVPLVAIAAILGTAVFASLRWPPHARDGDNPTPEVRSPTRAA